MSPSTGLIFEKKNRKHVLSGCPSLYIVIFQTPSWEWLSSQVCRYGWIWGNRSTLYPKFHYTAISGNQICVPTKTRRMISPLAKSGRDLNQLHSLKNMWTKSVLFNQFFVNLCVRIICERVGSLNLLGPPKFHIYIDSNMSHVTRGRWVNGFCQVAKRTKQDTFPMVACWSLSHVTEEHFKEWMWTNETSWQSHQGF